MNKKLIVTTLLASVIFSKNIYAAPTKSDGQIFEFARLGDFEKIKNFWEKTRLAPKIRYTSNLNAQDDLGQTALIIAAAEKDNLAQNERYSEIVRYLLSAVRSDPNITDNLGNTALMWAAQRGDIQSMEYLLADDRTLVNKVNNQGKTALDLAETTAKEDLLKRHGAKTYADLTDLDELYRDLTHLKSYLANVNRLLP